MSTQKEFVRVGMIVGDPAVGGHFEQAIVITEGEIVGVEASGKIRRVRADRPDSRFILDMPSFRLVAQHTGDALVVSDGSQSYSVGRNVGTSGRFESGSGQTYELAWGDSPTNLTENLRDLRRLP